MLALAMGAPLHAKDRLSAEGADGVAAQLPAQASPAPNGAPDTPPDTPPVGLIEAPKDAPATLPAASALHDDSASFFDGPDADMGADPSAMTALAAGPHSHPPIVVELFTSQGCSSCPMADELLGYLAARPDVLALSWHVDYWDYLGWQDSFARPEFTRRQKAYASTAGERSIYTPQIIVAGSETLLQTRPADLMALIDERMAQPVAISVTASGTPDAYQIELTPRTRPARDIAILLVRYAPQRRVDVQQGENHGMTLTYRNVVLAFDRLMTWDGKAPLRLNVTAADGAGQFPDDTRHAILAQQVGRKGRASGPILAAVRLD